MYFQQVSNLKIYISFKVKIVVLLKNSEIEIKNYEEISILYNNY